MASYHIFSVGVILLLCIAVEQIATERNYQMEFANKPFEINSGRKIFFGADRLSRMRRAKSQYIDSRSKRSPDGAPDEDKHPPTPPPQMVLYSETNKGCSVGCSNFPQIWRRFRGDPSMRVQLMDYDNEVTIIETRMIPFPAEDIDGQTGGGSDPMARGPWTEDPGCENCGIDGEGEDGIVVT